MIFKENGRIDGSGGRERGREGRRDRWTKRNMYVREMRETH